MNNPLNDCYVYDLIHSYKMDLLRVKVNDFLLKHPGWRAVGSPVYVDGSCYQAVSRN